MAIKGKKRSVENPTGPITTNESSKKKAKPDKVKPVTQVNGVDASKQPKKNKQKSVSDEKKIEKKPENGLASKKVKKVAEKSVVTKITPSVDNKGAELAALIKRKAKKREEKKEKMKSYLPEAISATVEELEERIQKIIDRDVITKTARRRLGVLRKKLKIKQGTYEPPTKKTASTMSKTEKRKLRRQKKVMKIRTETENGESEVDKVKIKAEVAAKAVKGVKAKPVGEKQLGNSKVVKKNSKVDNKKIKQSKPEVEKTRVNKEKIKLEKKIVEDDDDDDDEDDDDEQNNSMDVSINSTDTLDADDDEEEEDDEEEDDDDDEEEEEEEVEQKKPIGKVKNENKQIKVESEKKIKDKNTKNEKPSQKIEQDRTDATEKKSRYVLFVGNLPYSATTDDIKKHFLSKVSEVVSVRIPLGPENNPRGFAYVEFNNNVDYEKGLSLHQSNLNGRRINVQYSQSGSKDVGKRPNIVAKNQKLHALRKQGMLAGSTKDSQKRNARRNKGRNDKA